MIVHTHKLWRLTTTTDFTDPTRRAGSFADTEAAMAEVLGRR